MTPDLFQRHLRAIADWWLANTVDDRHGGFVGEIDFDGNVVEGADKSLVLDSRILWFFSEAGAYDPRPEYRAAADRAFDYLRTFFDDDVHGGAVWALAADGSVLDDKKQTYALCFCIYAYAAYFNLTQSPEAHRLIRRYFDLVETRTHDARRDGYLEAFTRDWQGIDDMRLGETDMNAPKTMNTHLHLLEAYTGLHRAVPDASTEQAGVACACLTGR